jgi:hypothetical protein
VGHWQETAYYVAPSSVINKDNTPKLALYKKIAPQKNKAVALLLGVKQFELRYGVALDNQPINYVSADSVTDWVTVRSVEINLTLDDDNSGSQNDLSWQEVVALRNR